MPRYPHRLKVTRANLDATPGAQDPDTGVFVPAPGVEPTTVYEDAADVQDAGARLAREETGEAVAVADAVAFLRNRRAVYGIRPDDLAEVTWDDPPRTVQQAVVRTVRRLDWAVELRWLAPQAPAGGP